MNEPESTRDVGQTSGLPVGGVSDSHGKAFANSPQTGLQRRPEPAGQTPAPRFLAANPSKLVSGVHSRGALPHLKREGASYFVTFRLAGTLPSEVLLELKRQRAAILHRAEAENRPLTWQEQKDLFNWYSERVDKYLDAGHGDCWLRRPEIADLVANALRYFEGERYALHAWVLMPNHVHTVVRPTPPYTLSSILKSWKGYTALQANRLLQREGHAFWQSESYDHCCREGDDQARCCRYTLMNPFNARLCSRPEEWPWSSGYVGQTSGLPVQGFSEALRPATSNPEGAFGEGSNRQVTNLPHDAEPHQCP